MADTFNPGSMPAARRTNGEYRRGMIAGVIAGLVGGGVLGAIIGAALSDGPDVNRPAQIGAGERTEDRVFGTDRPEGTALPGEAPLNEDEVVPPLGDEPGVR